jgi:hypothetical protein
MTGALLVARKDKIKVLRVVDGIKDREYSTSGIAKDSLHPMPKHHLMEYLAARETDEGIIEQ